MSQTHDNGGDPAELPTVNRMAMVLEPTKAYWEWAKQAPEDDDVPAMEDLRRELTVYLIPEVEGEPKAWLRRNYRTIFEYELDAWCTERSLWPDDRSFKVFKRFFHVRLASIVLDMGTGAIMREVE